MNDVEEFYAKLQQIAGVNVKGMIVVSGTLQQSALNFARSKGIAIVRLLPQDKVIWLAFHMTANMGSDTLNAQEFRSAFLNPDHKGMNRDFYATYNGYIFDGWHGVLRNMLSDS